MSLIYLSCAHCLQIAHFLELPADGISCPTCKKPLKIEESVATKTLWYVARDRAKKARIL